MTIKISIHAPHEGVRPGYEEYQILEDISIHAPHEGVRLRVNMTEPPQSEQISIHAPHEGVRLFRFRR